MATAIASTVREDGATNVRIDGGLARAVEVVAA